MRTTNPAPRQNPSREIDWAFRRPTPYGWQRCATIGSWQKRTTGGGYTQRLFFEDTPKIGAWLKSLLSLCRAVAVDYFRDFSFADLRRRTPGATAVLVDQPHLG